MWNAQPLVTPVTRPLKYYGRYTDSNGRPAYTDVREKGIDVLIALGIVMGAMRDEYDVAVLMSADTDLLPALETARELGKRVEVAAWRSRGWSSQLRLPGMWCHNLDEASYRRLHDPTDYTQPLLGEIPKGD